MHGNLPTDRSNSLGDLAARITSAHEQVGLAAKNVLEHAMAAGDMLAEAKDRVGHGRWGNWLKKVCNIPPRTASHYMRLAENRELIEVKSATIADLTVNAALRLLKPKKRKEPKQVKSRPAADLSLSSLVWSEAPARARRCFVDAVGLRALYAAAPAARQQEFRVWLLCQEAPASIGALDGAAAVAATAPAAREQELAAGRFPANEGAMR